MGVVPTEAEMGPWRFTVGSAVLGSRHGVGGWECGGWWELEDGSRHYLTFIHLLIALVILSINID